MPASFTVPPLSCDAHIHIYDHRFPTHPATATALKHATVNEYRLLQQRLGTERVVVVSPGVYRTDNRVTLDAIAQLGIDHARGVAVLHPDVDDGTLDQLNAGGIRGVRFTLFNPATAVTTVDMIEPLAKRIQRLGWHVQLHLLPSQIVQYADLIDRLPGPIVFDHFSRLLPVDQDTDAACKAVFRWLSRGNAWLKFSAPYLASAGPEYSGVQELAHAFLSVAPERIVWGSDWPHPTEQSGRMPDDAHLLACLSQWVPGADQYRRILVQNPEALYGFEPSGAAALAT
jgi:D-galactarolactone isomerase